MQPGSGPHAWQKLDAILAAVEDLRDHPCRFPIGTHRGVRERLCAGGWRVLYRVFPDTGSDLTAGEVRVLRVYGPDQGSAAALTILNSGGQRLGQPFEKRLAIRAAH